MDLVPAIALAWAPVPPGAPRRDVAWRLLRELAGAHVGIANPCPRCGGPHGPVVLVGDDRRASVSYSGSLAFAAVARPGVAALGLDAEPEERDLAGVDLAGGAPATARDWVRAEAVLKADGRGLSLDPAAVDVRRAPDGRLTARIGPQGSTYLIEDLAGPRGHVVSAAYRDA
ncbi:hypothetical protein GCM10017607_04980 [Microbacterium thalassium]|nr:hypothetical protein GCM10017607_04980 [Microbacterium thalassium]